MFCKHVGRPWWLGSKVEYRASTTRSNGQLASNHYPLMLVLWFTIHTIELTESRAILSALVPLVQVMGQKAISYGLRDDDDEEEGDDVEPVGEEEGDDVEGKKLTGLALMDEESGR